MNGPFDYSLRDGTQSYLIVCDGGNVRSYTLSTLLKLKHGVEAIAIGRLFTRPDTIKMLSGWADRIVLMQPHMIESIPAEFHNKVQVVDVGPDRWGMYIHPELEGLVSEKITGLLEGEGNG